MKIIFTLVAALWMASAALAVEPREMLKDPALEARARVVSKALRCVVCQNESIDESGAEIAADMRILVRQRIQAGETNAQVIAYMVGRYGDYVLLRPRFTAATVLLWLGPVVVLLLGGLVVARRLKRAGVTPLPLTPDEEAAIATLTDEGGKA